MTALIRNKPLELPARSGKRPTTGPEIPHQQLDQTAPAKLQEELWQRMAGLDGVRTGRSGISLPQTRALHLDPARALGPREAFMVGDEFAHLHGASDGSLHVALPPDVVAQAIETGWAEFHPLARRGMIPATHVMVYGPRDEAELETVWHLVEISYAFACGGERS
ncbi:luciferase family protein [Nonomuraea sp. NPDC049480]|uniref:luciferase domain-containing protein n=1 Tax=Nonomuraea sp. NPDC049480 TaxID=3364353 RepID=UPI00378748E3